MQGGKAAAETAISMQARGDYSAASTSQYERKWNYLYGYDFGKVSVQFLQGWLKGNTACMQLCHTVV